LRSDRQAIRSGSAAWSRGLGSDRALALPARRFDPRVVLSRNGPAYVLTRPRLVAVDAEFAGPAISCINVPGFGKLEPMHHRATCPTSQGRTAGLFILKAKCSGLLRGVSRHADDAVTGCPSATWTADLRRT
jgi:hypothetical protein